MKQMRKTGKRRRRGMTLVLSGIMMASVLCGCSGAGQDTKMTGNDKDVSVENENPAGGRFVEEELVMPEGIDRVDAMCVLSDGTLAVLADQSESEEYVFLTSMDQGESWESRAIEGVRKDKVARTAVAPDGTVAFCLYAGADEPNFQIADTEGNVTEYTVNLQKNGSGDLANSVWGVSFDRDGDLFVTDLGGNLLKIDLEDESCKAVDTNGDYVSVFGISGDRLLAFTENELYSFDTASLETTDAESVLVEKLAKNPEYSDVTSDGGFPIVFGDGSSESLLYACREGVFQLNNGGSVIAQLVDAAMTSISDKNMVFRSVGMTDAEHIFLAASNEGNAKILRFAFDKAVASTPEQELTVYALEESTELRRAIILFQKKYPDVYVNLKIGMSGEDGVTAEDALKILNTDIMAHEGPDVLIMDGLPVNSYIEKGILADISDVVSEVDAADGIYAPVKDNSIADDGKIYAIPAKFLVSLIDADEEGVRSAEGLSSLADRAEQLKQEYPDSNILPDRGGARGFLGEFYHVDSACWLKADGTLDRERLSNYLEQVKRLYHIDARNQRKEIEEFIINGTLEGQRLPSMYNDGLLTGDSRIAFGTLNNLDSLQLMISVEEQTHTSYGLLDQAAGGTYIPYLSIGVNVSGSVDTAKDFVREFLGKEVGADGSGCFPVNRAAYNQLCQEKMADTQELSMGGSTEDGDSYYIDYIQVTQAHIDKLNELMEQLKVPSLTDRTIRDLVIDAGEKYVLGEESLEDTVDAIMKKVDLYLAE